MKKNIIYIADSCKNHIYYHFYRALKKSGHKVFSVDPTGSKNIFIKFFINFINYRIKKDVLFYYLFFKLVNQLKRNKKKINLIILWQGEYYSDKIINYLKNKYKCPIANVIVDDPFTKDWSKRWSLFRRSMHLYDYLFVPRIQTLNKLKKICKSTFLFRRTYDEIAHKPYLSIKKKKFDVIFVGKWLESSKRDYYLKELILNDFNVKIFGRRWQKSNYYQILKEHVNPPVYNREYAKVVSESKICLGFLNYGNQDQDTSRTYEIPYMGGLLVAERSKVHVNTYKEDVDAVFFNNKSELLKKVRSLLDNHNLANRIRKNGMKKVKKLKVGNLDLVKLVISKVV